MGDNAVGEKTLRSVFVGNIPYDVTDEKLREIFGQAGPVVSFKLMFDRESGKPKGYGFCEYKDQETAHSAMRNLNGYEIGGRPLRVDAACTEKSRMEMQSMMIGQVEESPYGQDVNPDKAPEAISNAVASLPPEQMFELMRQMKLCVRNNPTEARTMLMNNPQLAYALLQAQVVMRIIDPKTAVQVLHGSRDPTEPIFPDNSVMGGAAPQKNKQPPMLNGGPQQGAPPAPVQQQAGPPGPRFPSGARANGPHTMQGGAQGGGGPIPFAAPAPVPPPTRQNMFNQDRNDYDLRQNFGHMDGPRGPPGPGSQNHLMPDQDMRMAPGGPDMGGPPHHMSGPDRGGPPHHMGGSGGMGGQPPMQEGRPFPMDFDQRGPPHGFGERGVKRPNQQDSRDRDQDFRGSSGGSYSRDEDFRSIPMPPQPGPPSAMRPSGVPGPVPTLPPNLTGQDQEKANLIMQVLQLSDEQIRMLPPEQQTSILQLKEQIQRSAQ